MSEIESANQLNWTEDGLLVFLLSHNLLFPAEGINYRCQNPISQMMKETSKRGKVNYSRIGVLILCLVAAASLISWGTSLDAHRARIAGPGALETGHWTKVRKNPPTYFPKGMPADHQTDFRSGYWVMPGGAQGNQFFVPLRGYGALSEKDLIAEAWAAATPTERARLEEEARREDRYRNIRKIVGLPLILVPYGGFMWQEL